MLLMRFPYLFPPYCIADIELNVSVILINPITTSGIIKYPTKRINLCKYMIHDEAIKDWSEIENYMKLTQNNFIFGVSLLEDVHQCIKNNIPFYYLKTLTTFDEINVMQTLGAAAVIIGGPIFFKMNTLAQFSMEKRVAANCAITDELPRTDGVAGSWIRPEDVEQYEDLIDIIEFQRVSQEQERALFRIYAEQHNWPGDLNMIIQDLNYPGVNRMIPPDLVQRRLNCGQRCKETSNCHLCWRMLDLANPALLKDYQKNMQ